MASKTFGSIPATSSLFGYSLYQATVNQAGTAAPVATNASHNFGATTFAWSRTSAGVDLITASAATFTAGKTSVVMSLSTIGLVSFKYIVTSSTVITITTALQSVIATILVGTPTDGLLIDTFVQIIVMD